MKIQLQDMKEFLEEGENDVSVFHWHLFNCFKFSTKVSHK